MSVNINDKIYELDNNIACDILTPGQSNYFTTQQFNSQAEKISDQALSILHLNSQSLNRKFEKIIDFLRTLKKKFKVIAITETWLKNTDNNTVNIEGYNMFSINRIGKRGGGVALYIDVNLNCKIVEQKTIIIPDLLEILTVEIIMDKCKNILISSIYRPPGCNVELFTEKIIEMLESAKKPIFLCGDFNINIGNPETTNDFKNHMQTVGLCPMITNPTRITLHSATVIDNIYTNIHGGTISGIFLTDLSDHLPVFVLYEDLCLNTVQEKYLITIRDRSAKAIEAFREDLRRQAWDQVYTNDINTAYNYFLETFIKSYDKNCKKREIWSCVKKKNSPNSPWLTKGLINACKKKNHLYKLFLKLRTKDAEERYKNYKNKLVSIIRRQKRDHYTMLLDKSKNSTKNTWGVINSVLHKGKPKSNIPNYITKNNVDIYGKKEIANEFNDFFIDIGPRLAQNIPIQNIDEGIIPNNINSIFLNPVQAGEILSIVQKFANKTSNDYIDLNMTLIKQTIDVIVEPFLHICNLSLTTGEFPDQMKVAKVIPLFKKANTNDVSNYRPISLLPQFSKILEKIFLNRLHIFIERHAILSNCQYGFRSKHSTATAIMEFAEEITHAMDNKYFLVSIFVDLQKAFDTLDHRILLQKLHRYGIRGVAHKWVTSYLNNRNQFVEINNVQSQKKRVTCGVPQGSVLGPVLFILYINDIVSVSNLLKCIMFADDTTLFYSGENVNTVLQTVQNEFEKIIMWFNANRLSLNISKTKYMIFSCKKNDIDVNLSVQGSEIERTHEIKFLGIMIDDNLTWKSHIDQVKSKVSQIVAVLHKVKESLNKSALFLLYKSMIIPYLTYCIEVWGNACKSYIEPLFLLQKRAIRVVNGSGFRAHTNPVFKQLQTLKFTELAEFSLLKIMYYAHQKTLPVNLQNRFKKRESTHDLRGVEIFAKPQFRTRMKERCISIHGVNFWNNLDSKAKTSKSIYIFKKNIKALLLKRYDNEW